MSDEIASRFRLHASFTLDPSSFTPYEYDDDESRNTNRICLHASRACDIPLTHQTRSTNLSLRIQLKGRAEVRLPKQSYEGFLNVEDPFTQHNWNRRWCTLDGLVFNVWDDVNNINKTPLLILDIRNCQQQLMSPAPRDVCARSRSFCFQGKIRAPNVEVSTNQIYFAAETQEDLNNWLEKLNFALDFKQRWLDQH